jgi:hypothetical protein
MKFMKIMMNHRFFNLLIFVFIPVSLLSQNIEENFLKRETFNHKIIQLDQLYGKRKTMTGDIKTEILTALSYFPELKETEIIFTGKKIKTTMQARPKYNLILKKRKNRVYYIYFNNNCGKHKSLNLNNFTFNALVGLIGHELSHITYYSGKNSMTLTADGLRYLVSGKFKMDFEKNTDIIAIRHNLGYSLYENRLFMLNCPEISEQSKKRIRTYYLNPEEILELIWKFAN